MKIVFTGCSYTYGSELKNIDRSRYSRLLCQSIDAEEVNLAVGGSGNDAIFLRLIEYLETNNASHVIIQLTDDHRLSIAGHNPGTFTSLNMSCSRNQMPFDLRRKISEYIYNFGKNNTEAWYRMTRYKLIMVNDYLKNKNIDYVICVKRNDGEYGRVNNYLNDPLIPETIKKKFLPIGLDELSYGHRSQGPAKGHPIEQGHKIIAEALEEKLRELYF